MVPSIPMLAEIFLHIFIIFMSCSNIEMIVGIFPLYQNVWFF